MDKFFKALNKANISYYLASYSALNKFFKIRGPKHLYLLAMCDHGTLAKVCDKMEFLALPFQDVTLSLEDDLTYHLILADDLKTAVRKLPFSCQKLLYHPKEMVFYDPENCYPELRANHLRWQEKDTPSWFSVMEAAKLISTYHYDQKINGFPKEWDDIEINPDAQRDFLSQLLTAPHPQKGLQLLKQYGFLKRFWPELDRLSQVEHLKDYHPEGDVWTHTLETFQYRKTFDLSLSLGLLLHDIGKLEISGPSDRPFYQHSEVGISYTVSFLKRMNFPSSFIDEITFLVRHHMIPMSLDKLPIFKTSKIMDSPLFPTVLELYRADVSSTFRGPDSYYEACRIYRKYLANKKNPFRKNDGKLKRRL